MDEAFDTLVGVCGELGARLDNIDTLGHEIDGKSKATWKMWGRKFHARVIKDSSGIHIEVYDLGLLPNDFFIKELYNTFTRYTSASPLVVDLYVKFFHALRKGDMRFSGDERAIRMEESGEPLPSGGAPAIVADMPDQVSDTAKALLTEKKICGKCGVTNDPASKSCSNCGFGLISCPNCGYNSSEEASFCTKCGILLK